MEKLTSEEYESLISYYKGKVSEIEFNFLILQLDKKRSLENLKKELAKEYEMIINNNNDKLNQKILDMTKSYLDIKKEFDKFKIKLEKNTKTSIKKKTTTIEK
jgi:hypothetical protein